MMKLLIRVTPQSSLNVRERSPHTRWNSTGKGQQLSGSLSSVPVVFLSNIWWNWSHHGTEKSSLKHNLKKCVMVQEIKGFNFKSFTERPFYRGKTIGKDCSTKKFQMELSEIKQETGNSRPTCIWRFTYIQKLWRIWKVMHLKLNSCSHKFLVRDIVLASMWSLA